MRCSGLVSHAQEEGEHVILDADQVTYQALHVQAPQGRHPPVIVAQRAQQPVKGVGCAAERLGRRDLRDLRDGAADCAR